MVFLQTVCSWYCKKSPIKVHRMSPQLARAWSVTSLQYCAHDLLICQPPVTQRLMALQAVCHRSANSLPMPRPRSASELHARPMTHAWFCKMSASPPMARPRSANVLSVACLLSVQHPLEACARSAHDVPLVNQRHAHGFANGRLMLCQVCMLVVKPAGCGFHQAD